MCVSRYHDNLIANKEALRQATSIQFIIVEADVGQPVQAGVSTVDVAVNVSEVEIRLASHAIPIPWQWLGLLAAIVLAVAIRRKAA